MRIDFTNAVVEDDGYGVEVNVPIVAVRRRAGTTL